LVTLNADQYIKDNQKFFAALDAAARAVTQYPDHAVLLGVNPTYPETGYGYIEVESEKMSCNGMRVYAVRRFVEKPDLATAKTYISSWQYLWNPALFVWRLDTLCALFGKYLPGHTTQFRKLGESCSREAVEACFSALEPISIDYGILEKAEKLLVVPGDFGWTDIGHWRSIAEVVDDLPQAIKNGSLHIAQDSSGNFMHTTSGKLVATIGVHDMILMEAEDAILVCPRDRAQEVKDIVGKLEEKNLKQYV